MRKGTSHLLKAIGLLQSLFGASYISAFWGKTELELNGIGVIKESAQILANSIDTFPSRSTAIAFIGLIMFSKGIYLFGKGIVNILSSSNNNQIRSRGKAQFMIGAVLAIGGTLATLYCANLAILGCK